MTFPYVRMRRLRQAPWIRELVAENHLKPSDLILPLFIIEGDNQIQEIDTMPSVRRFSVDKAVEIVKLAYENGIKLVALFPVIEISKKDELGSEAFNRSCIIYKAIKEIKKHVPNIGVMVDVALDPFTNHGHDGIIKDDKVDNDLTIDSLVKYSLMLASAGCDIVAPSDMMDGRITSIRQALEDEGHVDIIIISYAAKYASAFYGPFRDAIKSQRPQGESIDKKTYQMDVRNSLEALREAELDEIEGADMLIIKPGMPCLDIIAKVASVSTLPIIAYQVSGEYSMIKFASASGAIDYQSTMLESLIAFKRAGARAIITYAALDVAKMLKDI